MAIDNNLIPSEFTNAEGIGWILCGEWGTGGTTSEENKGNINRPINRIFGNTVWLKNKVEEVEDGLESHVSDDTAHWESIRGWMDYPSDEYFDTSLPGNKVKDSLSEVLDEYDEVIEDNRIENAQVSESANIEESKIDLSLREKQRASQESGYFNTTGDLAEDINTLFNLYGGSKSAFFDSLKHTINSIMMSGWIENYPHILLPIGENSVKTVRETVVLNKENNLTPNINLHGVPVILGNSGTEGEFTYPMFFTTDNLPFYYAKSSNIYTATDLESSGRKDLIFLEMWIEDIEQKNDVALYGDVMCGAFNWFFEGTAPDEAGLEDKFRYFHSGTFLNTIDDPESSNPEHLVFSNSTYQPIQVRFRIIVCENEEDMQKASPQAILPLPANRIEEIEFSATVNEYEFELANEGDTLTLFTGNKVVLSSGSLPFDHVGDLYVCRVNDTTIKLADSLSKCLGENNTYFLMATSSGTFSLKCYTGASDETYTIVASDLEASEESTFSIDSSLIDVVDESPVRFEVLEENFSPYLNFEFDVDEDFIRYYLRRESGNNFSLYGVYLGEGGNETETRLKLQYADGEEEDRFCGRLVITYLGKQVTLDISTYTYNDEESSNEVFIIDNRDWDGIDELQVEVTIEPSFYLHSNIGEIVDNNIYYCKIDTEYSSVTLYKSIDELRTSTNLLGFIYVGCDPDQIANDIIEVTTPILFKKSESNPYEFYSSINLGEDENYGVFGYPLFKIAKRNAGIYHPLYNPNGTSISNGAPIAGIANCFDEDFILCYKQDTYDILQAKTITAIKAEGTYSSELSTNDYYVSGGVTYYRSGYLAEKAGTGYFGISGRPDGLFYNSVDYSDIVDLRHKINCCTDLNQIINKSLDSAFRGGVVEDFNEPTMSDGSESGVLATSFLQRDIIKSESTGEVVFGNVIDEKIHKIVDDEEWSSFDGIDGVRRVWSDEAVEQTDSEIASFGNAIDETSNVYGEVFENFTTYKRINTGETIDIDYNYYKYIYFDGTTPAYKRALSGVRVYRIGPMSGDYYGSDVDLDKRRVSFSDENSDDKWGVYERLTNRDSALEITSVRTVTGNSNISFECTGYTFEQEPSGAYRLYVKNNSDEYISEGFSIYTSNTGDPETLVSIVKDEYSTEYIGSVVIGYYRDGLYVEEEIDVAENYSDDSKILGLSNPIFTDYTFVSLYIPRPNETALVKVNPFRIPKPLKDNQIYRIQVTDSASKKFRLTPLVPENDDDYIEFEADNGYINESAKIQFIPQPVIINNDGTADIKLTESVDCSAVNETTNTVPLGSKWLTGTPVCFDNINWFSEEFETSDVFYLILKNQETGEYVLATSSDAAIAYLRKVNIESAGVGSFEMFPVNSSENINTRLHRALLLEEAQSSFRSSFRSSQNWETGNPVHIQSFDEIVTPQHQYTDRTLDVEVSYFVPVDEISEYIIELDEAGTYTNSVSVSTTNGDCFFALPAGNDIPTGFVEGKTYYIHVTSNGETNGNKYSTFYLSDSFFASLLGRKTSCGGVTSGGKVAITPCKVPDTERILLSSGGIDTESDSIIVSGAWETGMCVSVSPFGNTHLPSGLSTDNTLFVEKVGDNKIKLIQDFKRYFSYKIGEYEGMTNPFDIRLSDEEELLLDDYFYYGLPTITHFERGGDTIYGGYTFSVLTGVEIHGSNLEDVTEVRFGNNTIESGDFSVTDDVITLDVPVYAYDSLVEVSVKSGGIWSNTIYYMYFSAVAPEKFYIFHIDKSGMLSEDNPPSEATSLNIYCYYSGLLEEITTDYDVYAERYGVSDRNTNLVAGTDEAISINISSAVRIPDPLGNDTPIVKITFNYTPPAIESTVGNSDVKQSITDFSFIDSSTQDLVSRNTISFSSFVVSNNYSFSYISGITVPKDTEYIVPFGSNNFTNRVRIIMPGYSGTTAVFEVIDSNDQWTEVVTGYKSIEEVSGTLTEVFYIELPRKIAVGNVNIHLLSDDNVFCEAPYLNTNSPVVFEKSIDVSNSCLTETIADFNGYGLDSINKVFMKVYNGEEVELFYYANCSIIDKDDNRITVLLPRVYNVDEGSPLKVYLDFISYEDGSSSIPVTYSSSEYYNYDYPIMSKVFPPDISCETEDEYFNYIVTNGTIDLEIFGSRLNYIDEVILDVNAECASISLEIIKKETGRMIVRLPQISAGDKIVSGSYTIRYRTLFEKEINFDIEEDLEITLLELSFTKDANYDITPFITSVSSYSVNNYEETVFSIYGNNLADVTSVQIGTQSFDQNQIEVSPGISGGVDQLVVTLSECDDTGTVPVIVTTLYGETEYYISYPRYITQIASPYVDFKTSGVGELQLLSQSWVDEEIGTNPLVGELEDYSLSDVFVITQNLPTGLPVTIDNVDKYIVNTNLSKFNLIDSLGTTFTSYPNGGFVLIKVPQIMVDGSLEDDDTQGIGRYMDNVITDYLADSGDAILLDRTMWNNSDRVIVHALGDGFPPTETQIQTYMTNGEVYDLSLVDGSYFVKFSDTMLSSLSENPVSDAEYVFSGKTLSPSGSKKAYGIFDHEIDEELEGGSSVYGYLDNGNDIFKQVNIPTSVCWMTGIPVKLGSNLTGIDASVHYNVGDSNNIMLSKSIVTVSYENISDGSHGFVELKKTWPDLKADNIYYVENIGSGRIRVYDSAVNLVTGNYLQFKENNESSLHFVPIMGEKVIETGGEYTVVDTELDEIYTSLEYVESGSPVRFSIPDDAEDDWVLPGGLEEGKTYFVYKSMSDSTNEQCGITLFENYRDALLLEAYVKGILSKNISVTMSAIFEGASVGQSKTTNLDLTVDEDTSKVKSTIALDNYSDIFFKSGYSADANNMSAISGVPVAVVSDTPIIDDSGLIDSNRELKIKYTLCYEGGRGLTDRPYNSNIDNRLEIDRNYSGDCRDKYLVIDGRYDNSCSLSGFEYWNKNSLSKFLEYMNVEEGSSAENFYKAYFNSIKYTDITIPSSFNGTTVPTDKYTLVFGEENEYLGYDGSSEFTINLTDYVPPYFRNKEFYVNFVVYRTSDISPCYGVPKNDGSGDIYSSSAVTVTWNKATNTLSMSGMSEGNKVSFRVGLTIVEDLTLSEGTCQGSVFDFNAQTKEIHHTGIKRILSGEVFGWKTEDYPEDHSWDFIGACLNNEFRDVLAFSGTAWKEGEEGEGLTLSHDNGGANFVLNNGVCNLTLSEEIEFLYIADSKNLYMGLYTEEVAPPKEDLTIYYARNIQDIQYIEDGFTTLVNPNIFISSVAGSKSSTDESNIYQYPYLLFSIPTINKTYTYSLKDNTIKDITGLSEISYDSSFLMSKDIVIQNSPYVATGSLSDLSYSGSLSSLVLNNKIESRPTIISLSNKSISPDPSVEIIPYLEIREKILYIVLCIMEGTTVRHYRYKCHGNIMIKEF